MIDIYTHIFPDRFYEELSKSSPKLGNMGKRLRQITPLFDLDVRFRDMDKVGPDYRQVISLPNPPIEDIASPELGLQLARVANDAMADLCQKYPDRFAAFAAACCLTDVEGSLKEIDRAINQLGARGVQTFTNIKGKPLDLPEFEPFFAAMAQHDLPIWIHPARTADDFQTTRPKPSPATRCGGALAGPMKHPSRCRGSSSTAFMTVIRTSTSSPITAAE